MMQDRSSEGSRLSKVRRAIHHLKNTRNDLFLKIYTENPVNDLLGGAIRFNQSYFAYQKKVK